MRLLFLAALATTTAITYTTGCGTADGSKLTVSKGLHAKKQVASKTPKKIGKKTALVELFTSQGCSSCPPADRLLPTLDKSQADVDVVPLAFHVDYWNYIGWKDPFSSGKWSSRQRQYAQRLNKGGSYTPQLVVNGKGHAVGSQKTAVYKQIQKQALAASVPVSVQKSEFGVKQVTIQVKIPDGTASSRNVSLVLAVYENGISTKVVKGENAGKNLVNDYVVRDLATTPLKPSETSYKLRVPTQPGWNQSNLGAVIFLQDQDNGHVLGVHRIRRP